MDRTFVRTQERRAAFNDWIGRSKFREAYEAAMVELVALTDHPETQKRFVAWTVDATWENAIKLVEWWTSTARGPVIHIDVEPNARIGLTQEMDRPRAPRIPDDATMAQLERAFVDLDGAADTMSLALPSLGILRTSESKNNPNLEVHDIRDDPALSILFDGAHQTLVKWTTVDMATELDRGFDQLFSRLLEGTLDAWMGYYLTQCLVVQPPLVITPHIASSVGGIVLSDIDVTRDINILRLCQVTEFGGITLHRFLANPVPDVQIVALICTAAYTLEAAARFSGCCIGDNHDRNWMVRDVGVADGEYYYANRPWAYTIDGRNLFVIDTATHGNQFLERIDFGLVESVGSHWPPDHVDLYHGSVKGTIARRVTRGVYSLIKYILLGATWPNVRQVSATMGKFLADLEQKITGVPAVGPTYFNGIVEAVAAKMIDTSLLFRMAAHYFPGEITYGPMERIALAPSTILLGSMHIGQPPTPKQPRMPTEVPDADQPPAKKPRTDLAALASAALAAAVAGEGPAVCGICGSVATHVQAPRNIPICSPVCAALADGRLAHMDALVAQ